MNYYVFTQAEVHLLLLDAAAAAVNEMAKAYPNTIRRIDRILKEKIKTCRKVEGPVVPEGR